MSLVQASEAFQNLHRGLRALVEQRNQAGKLRALALSPVQLARAAERLPEFGSLVMDLFEPPSVEDLMRESNIDDPEEAELNAEGEWDARFFDYSAGLADLLKRSGYYHAVLSGSDEIDCFYSVIKDRIPAKKRAVTKLYLLDGCRFSCDQFEVAGVPVVRMSGAELERFGPSSAVCKDFFPKESIDSGQLSECWFLKVQEDAWTAYDSDLLADGLDLSCRKTPPVSANPEEVAAGHMAATKVAAPLFPKYLDAILLLSLYKPEFFEITKILVCEPGWRRVWHRSRTPRGRTWALFQEGLVYAVSESGWPAFEEYLELASLGLENGKASADARPLMIANRRYLQATFATGDVFPEWETSSLIIEHPRHYGDLIDLPGVVGLQAVDRADVLEDAVLHYVFALEALLSGDTREAIGEKVAVSAALLIGRGGAEAVAVRSLVKKAYDGRSALVHGRELKALDVNKLRRVCQRVLAVVLSLYAERQAVDLPGLLRELPVSPERQRQVEEVRERILALLGNDRSLLED